MISDIMMDKMDGYELLKNISWIDAFKSIPFIFISAKSSIEDKLDGLSRGPVDYIVKPFSINELEAKIEILIKILNMQASN
jgi:DNA-binding response OmpR family regulator